MMKTILVAVGMLFAISACNKCVTCNYDGSCIDAQGRPYSCIPGAAPGETSVKFCKGDSYYNAAKNGSLTDASGSVSLKCN